jgi:hypothetical protein
MQKDAHPFRSQVGRLLFGSTLLLGATLHGQVLAQTAQEPVLTGNVQEEFSERVKTSGTSLVGVMLGDPKGQSDVANLRALLPRNHGGQQLCFLATTSDGIYHATGVLRAPAKSKGMMRVSPTGFPRYAKELAAYPSAAFAGVMALSDDCVLKNATLIPVLLGEPDPRILHVAVNTSHAPAVAAKIHDHSGKVSADGRCEPADGRRKAFDYSCRFELTSDAFRSGINTLVISSKPPGAPRRSESYKLRLDP